MAVVRKYATHKGSPDADSKASITLLVTDTIVALMLGIAVLGIVGGSFFSGSASAGWALFAVSLVPYLGTSLMVAMHPSKKLVIASMIVSVITVVFLLFAMPLGNSGISRFMAFFPCAAICVGFIAEIFVLRKVG